jgi:chromosome segregation ATPase
MSLKGLLLLGVVAFATAIPRGAEVLVELDQTPMGSALLSTIHLQLETETPVDDIVSLLQEIADDLSKQQDDDDRIYKDAMTHCEEMKKFYNGQIDEAKNEINTQEANLARDRPELERVKGEITTNEQTLKNQESDRKAAAQKREDDNKLFKERDAEFEDSVKACNEAVEILNDLKYEKKYEAKDLVALQLSNIKTRISKSMNDMQSGLYGPSIKALVQVAANGDEVTVETIISLIKTLRDDLDNARTQDTAAETKAQATWENYDSDIAEAIEGTKDTLKRLNKDKSDLETAIRDAEDALRNAETKKSNNEGLLKTLIDSCDAKTSKYNNDLSER